MKKLGPTLLALIVFTGISFANTMQENTKKADKKEVKKVPAKKKADKKVSKPGK
jgi:hypothetical protein